MDSFAKWAGAIFLFITVGLGSTVFIMYGEIQELKSNEPTNKAQWRKLAKVDDSVRKNQIALAFDDGVEKGRSECRRKGN